MEALLRRADPPPSAPKAGKASVAQGGSERALWAPTALAIARKFQVRVYAEGTRAVLVGERCLMSELPL